MLELAVKADFRRWRRDDVGAFAFGLVANERGLEDAFDGTRGCGRYASAMASSNMDAVREKRSSGWLMWSKAQAVSKGRRRRAGVVASKEMRYDVEVENKGWR